MSRPATVAAEPVRHRAPATAQAATHGLLPAVQSLIYIIIVALFIITFSVQPFRIPSASMEPTLLIGDFLLVDKELPSMAPGPLPPAGFRRGDIVVFHFPVDPSLHLVKRIIGLPGERIRLRGGHVYINDQPLTEPYAAYFPSAPDSFRDNFPYTRSTDPDVNAHWWLEMQHLLDHGDLRIPSGHYFVLGDNRNNSEDSRYWGLVPARAIVGRPVVVYLSLREPDPDDSANLAGPSPTLGGRLRQLIRWHRTLHVIR